MLCCRRIVLGVLAVVFAPSVAGAESIVTVSVGDIGNMNDNTGYGAVSYPYNIGKYDVTNAQYVEFLNAKASSSDPYGLWNSHMSSDTEGGINRSGSGPYTYTVKPGQGNQPVVDTSWYDAIRFVNWLTNGQQNGDTESGTYAITNGGKNSGTVAIPSARNARLGRRASRIGSCRAKTNGTRRRTTRVAAPMPVTGAIRPRATPQPTSQAPPGGSNSANFNDPTTGYAVTGSTTYNPSQDYLTDVGAYAGSPSAYGTLDQGGDVWQWDEADINGDGSVAWLAGRVLGPQLLLHSLVGAVQLPADARVWPFRFPRGRYPRARRRQRRRQSGHQRPDDRADQLRSDRA